MSTLVDRVVPARLGPGTRRLVASSWLVQLTDGIALVAGPLAVASLTGAPLLVALAVALHRLPVLLLGPYAALLADLVHRRLLVVGADAGRGLVVLLLAALLAVGAVPVALALVVMAVLGVLETIADAARTPVLPMLAPDPDQQDVLGARLDAGFVAGSQLLGPVAGALLFTLGPAVPFLAQGLLLAAAVLVFRRVRLVGPARGPAPVPTARPVGAGLRRIAVDPALSGLVLAGLAAQTAWAAGWALLVLYVTVHLDLGAVVFGVLVAAGAVGGLLGILVRPALVRLARSGPVTPPRLVLAALALEATGYGCLAVLRDLWAAGVAVAVLGAVAFLAGDLARELRRTRTAADGTDAVVAAACARLGLVATVVGAVLGGLLAEVGTVATAYVGGAVLLGLSLIVLSRRVLTLGAL